jgi:nicotinamidase/pyrazinamidase
MKALIVVDLQNDFMPGGALPVPQGDAVIPLANQLQGFFTFAVATQEWRPAIHRSFAANHAGKKPGDLILVRKQILKLLPVHCVQNTRGAEFAFGFLLNRVNKIIRKGTDPEIDSSSAFFDQGHTNATGLSDYLHDKRVTQVFVMGVATEHCVKATALDAIGLSFKTFLIEDACRGMNLKPGDAAKAIDEMKEAGVKLVSSHAILRAPARNRPS